MADGTGNKKNKDKEKLLVPKAKTQRERERERERERTQRPKPKLCLRHETGIVQKNKRNSGGFFLFRASVFLFINQHETAK